MGSPPRSSATAEINAGNQSFLVSFGENYGISKNFVAILVAIAWRHTGYIMVLYLAGLKSVDNSLREAARLWTAAMGVADLPARRPSRPLKPITMVIHRRRYR